MNIGDHRIDHDSPCFVVAEIGINHNGSTEIAKALIDAAVEAGADAVKFQKRTVELVYTPEELAAPRESPFGTTNGDLKRALELDELAYAEIAGYCEVVGIEWFASPWDVESVKFLVDAGSKALKVPSALLTDVKLLDAIASEDLPIIAATGMSTFDQVLAAVKTLHPSWDNSPPLALLACTAAYPAKPEDLHLRRIKTLRDFFAVPVGWSGHEVGVYTSVAAVALGACIVERHLTLDRSMWGSDHAASLEPKGFKKMVEEIRTLELALGLGVLTPLPCEAAAAAKLRKVNP